MKAKHSDTYSFLNKNFHFMNTSLGLISQDFLNLLRAPINFHPVHCVNFYRCTVISVLFCMNTPGFSIFQLRYKALYQLYIYLYIF